MVHGIKISAGVVTAAAVVMVFVFLTFATLSMVEFKEMGVGLAVAVLLDATIVRAMLLPATMKLLGRATGTCPGGSNGCRGSPTPRRRPRRAASCRSSGCRRAGRNDRADYPGSYAADGTREGDGRG